MEFAGKSLAEQSPHQYGTELAARLIASEELADSEQAAEVKGYGVKSMLPSRTISMLPYHLLWQEQRLAGESGDYDLNVRGYGGAVTDIAVDILKRDQENRETTTT